MSSSTGRDENSIDMWSTVSILTVELLVNDVPQNKRECGCECKIANQQQPEVPVASQDSEADENQAYRQEDASRLYMVQSDAKQQVVYVVLVRQERRTVLFDTREADANGVKDRNGQHANSNSRRSRHMKGFGHFVIRVDLAEMEDKSRQYIA